MDDVECLGHPSAKTEISSPLGLGERHMMRLGSAQCEACEQFEAEIDRLEHQLEDAGWKFEQVVQQKSTLEKQLEEQAEKLRQQAELLKSNEEALEKSRAECKAGRQNRIMDK